MSERLSLMKALKTGRLADFIAQEEARGVESVEREELDAAIEAMIKPPRSANRTSRSRGRGGSSGT